MGSFDIPPLTKKMLLWETPFLIYPFFGISPAPAPLPLALKNGNPHGKGHIDTFVSAFICFYFVEKSFCKPRASS